MDIMYYAMFATLSVLCIGVSYRDILAYLSPTPEHSKVFRFSSMFSLLEPLLTIVMVFSLSPSSLSLLQRDGDLSAFRKFRNK